MLDSIQKKELNKQKKQRPFRRHFLLYGGIFLLFVGSLTWGILRFNATPEIDLAAQEKQLVYAQLLEQGQAPTLPFVRNDGQKDEQVRFYAPIESGTVYVGEDGITYDTQNFTEEGVQGLALKESFLDLGKSPMRILPQGEKQASTTLNQYLGNDQSEWKSDLETFGFVNFGEIYPKIELKIRATEKNVEKLFIVDVKGNPSDIRLSFQGAEKMEVTETGELKISNGGRELVLTTPQAYQYKNGKKKYIAVSYQLGENNSYGFKVEHYDDSRMLVIDPMIASTLIGGSEEEHFEFYSANSTYVGRPKMVQDVSGNIYVVGHTRSSNYPTSLGAYDLSFNDADPDFGNDIVVSKFNSDLTTLLASTYLGGTGEDNGMAIQLDGSGNVYVSGFTESSNFPLAGTSYQSVYQGGTYDVFVAKFSSDLVTLSASTYLGGSSEEQVFSLLFDGTSLYLAGNTTSSNFPVSAEAHKTVSEGTVEGFVSQLTLDLSTLTASTFLGGNNDDYVKDLTIYAGNLYLAGHTNSTTNLAYGAVYDDSYNGGISDGFLAGISSDLTTLNQATYLGGTSLDYAIALEIDSTGRVVVTGSTQADFPVTTGAYDETQNSSGQHDMFVAILPTTLSTLSAATYLGGNGSDEVYDLIIGDADTVYLSGYTTSTDYPANNTLNGSADGTISKLDSTLSTFSASTLLGGSSNIDKVFGLDMTTDEKILAIGITDSADFPTTTGAYQESSVAKRDVFVTKITTDLLIDQTPHHLQLSIGGSATPTIRAGMAETLTIEAKDVFGVNLIDYSGDRSINLTGAVDGPDGTAATCNGTEFGTAITLTFVSGSASCSLLVYKADNLQSFDAEEIGGENLDTFSSANYDLSPLIQAGAISAAESRVDSPNEHFSSSDTITARVLPYDAYQNPMGAIGNEAVPDVDLAVTGSNPGTFNALTFAGDGSGGNPYCFQTTYSGTIAGHDQLTATINSVAVAKDNDPSSTAPYDGDNGTRHVLGFDHLEVTVSDLNTLSGTTEGLYTLQVRAKNSLRETLTTYAYSNAGVVFSGINDSPYGFKSNCTNKSGTAIDFGSSTQLDFSGGLTTCNLTITGAQSGTSIEATHGAKNSQGNADYDLDINITAGGVDHLNVREGPNPVCE